MSNTVISIENVSKTYQLGTIGTGTFRGDLRRWWAQVRGLPDPELRIGEKEHGNRQGETIWALKNINLQIEQGEILGVIGRNGAGKSTLLKLLSRVTAPTDGEIKIKGRIASLLEVGTGFHPELTGRENVFLNGAIMGMSRAEVKQKFEEIVAFSGVEQFIDTPVKRYSSGMYVRLAFAVAAHLEPEILVVDEVLAVGDAEFQRKCLGKMGDVAKEGRTVLFVSHNMGAISHLCQNTIWVDKGHLRLRDNTNRVISNYILSEATMGEYKEWPNGLSQPGVDEFQLLSVGVINDAQQVTSTLDIHKPFWIEIKYRINKGLPYCRVGINVHSELGGVVFEAYDSDDAHYAEARKPGIYVSRCKLPGDYFNAKRYYLSVYAGIPPIKYLAGAENVLVIDIQDTGEADFHTMEIKTREGVVRPKLTWEVVRQRE